MRHRALHDRVNILFPIETINRELDFRLLLASMAASSANRLFIGQHDVIYRLVRYIHGGIYLGKNIFLTPFPTDLSRYHFLKEQGFVLIHLDEEGLSSYGEQDEWGPWLSARLDVKCLSKDDHVCTWGDYQRDFYRGLQPACIEHVQTTGHPRFDLYKQSLRAFYDPYVTALRAKYGDFILVNTLSSMANNPLGLSETFKPGPLNQYDPSDRVSRLHYFNDWADDAIASTRFARLVNRLSVEHPDRQIVLRPHPSEDWQHYRAIFQGVSNVHVVHEGPVAPWLLACRTLIHDRCTTGIEAHLAGSDIIIYKAVPEIRNDMFLANVFGVKCFSEDEAVSAVNHMFSTPHSKGPGAPVDERAYALLDNLRRDSFPTVLSVISQAQATLLDEPGGYSKLRLDIGEACRITIDSVKSLARPLFSERQRRYDYFRRQHFYGLSAGNVVAKMAVIQGMLQKQIRYTVCNDSLMMIEQPA